MRVTRHLAASHKGKQGLLNSKRVEAEAPARVHVVLSKQAGLVTHPADGHPEQDTLVNALIAHCGREKLCNVQGEQKFTS